jgi:tRNA G37 N-methylase TrmD
MEADMNQMDLFLHHANIENFRKQLADTTDQVRRQTLLELLASEENKDKLLPGKTA